MTTFSDKEIMIAANAIGWIFYGDQSEDGLVVEVPEEDSGKCVDAAKRALTSIEKYREGSSGADKDTSLKDDLEQRKQDLAQSD